MNIHEIIKKRIEEVDIDEHVSHYIERHLDSLIRNRIEESAIKCIELFLQPIDDELSKIFYPKNED